jgi:Domain of unknown function (DUF4118)
MESTQEPLGRVAFAFGTIGAVLIAGLLSHVRDDVGSANVALALACVVVAAALAGRLAGAATAITAAIAYDYFHTQPYNSLRVNTARDTVTIGLLLLIGLVVSEMSAWRRRARAAASRQTIAARRLEQLSALLADGADIDRMWPEVRSALIDTLHLSDCRFEPGPDPPQPVLPRSGALAGTTMQYGVGGFRLPAEGASIPVTFGGRTLGHLVVIPDRRSGSALDARQAAIAFADLYAVAMTFGNARRPGRAAPDRMHDIAS